MRSEALVELLKDEDPRGPVLHPLRSLTIIVEKAICLEGLKSLVWDPWDLSRPWNTAGDLKLKIHCPWNVQGVTNPSYPGQIILYPITEGLPPATTRLRIEIPLNESVIFPLHLTERLTHLTYAGDLNYDVVFSILNGCRNIEALSLSYATPSTHGVPAAVPTWPSFVMTSLRSLKLRFDVDMHIDYLLLLQAPNIRTLELVNIGSMLTTVNYDFLDAPPAGPYVWPIMEFIRRSGCRDTLTHLRLVRFELPRLAALLFQLPGLTDLILSADSQHASAANFLFDIVRSAHTDTSIPLPFLRALTILDIPYDHDLDLACFELWEDIRGDVKTAVKYVEDVKLWDVRNGLEEQLDEWEIPDPFYV